MTPPPRRRGGFTLLEVLGVFIRFMALVGALFGPFWVGVFCDARTTSARTQLEIFALALDNYRLDNGSYPTTEQGLAALRERPRRGPAPMNWRGPYLRKEVPLDPWGRPYVYRSPGERNAAGFDLVTLGRDGASGGSGEDTDIIIP
jgi:general secretion pathway protein G